MRLREIQKILEDNIEDLKLPMSYERSGSSSLIKTTNYSQFINAVNNVKITGLFEKQINNLSKNNLIIVLENKHLNFDQESLNRIKVISKEFVDISFGALNVIHNSFNNIDEPDDTLAILLPEIKMSFNLMGAISKELDTFFRLLKVIPDFNTDVKIETFDKGTNWLLVLLGSDTALTLLSKLLNIVHKSRLQNSHISALNSQLTSLKLSDEALSEVKRSLAEKQTEIYNQLAEEFLETNDLKDRHEIQTQMAKAISTLNNIYDMGVSFQPSINASQEALEKFPDLESQKTIFNLESLKKLTFDSED